MIDLRTGTPGACKTLSAVEALSKMIGRWEKHPDEARPIFVHGVKDLALPHSPVPTREWVSKQGAKPQLVPDWDAMPDGSYVLLDEAQGFFPPRGSASEPPAHVAWLNTHRHRGFDITVITQHPKLIDASVRALVGKHQHFRRLFGGSRSICYEWDACSDGLAGLANAVTSYYPFPKKAFQWYKSAEVHTKQNFRLPSWLLVPVVAIVIGVFAFPKAYSTLSHGMGGHALSAPIAASPIASGAASGAFAPAPRSTSSALAAIENKVLPKHHVAGCMATATRCLCVEPDGSTADVADDECRVASVALGGLVPYDTAHRVEPKASRPASPMPPSRSSFELPRADAWTQPDHPISTESVVTGTHHLIGRPS